VVGVSAGVAPFDEGGRFGIGRFAFVGILSFERAESVPQGEQITANR